MFSGRRRWTCLALLAAGNLLLWAAVSCLVGLCAGDAVDLGVETLVRHAQATAVASWEHVRDAGLARLAGEQRAGVPVTLNQDGEHTAGLALDGGRGNSLFPTATPTQARAGDASGSDGAPAVDAAVTPAAVALKAAGNQQAAISLKAAVSGEPATDAGQAGAAPDNSARTTVSAPLLLVDPEFHTLTAINAEMDRSAQGRAVQIRCREEALNREIAAILLRHPGLPYHDVQVDLLHNRVAISGQVTILGVEVDALLEGTLIACDCMPRLQVESISLGGVTTPRFVRTRVAAMAHDSMAWYPADYPLCLEQIVLEETGVTIYGYRR